MFTAENRVGRVVEIRLIAPMSIDEVPAFGAACKREMGKALRRQPGKLAVSVTDLRLFAVLSPEVFGALRDMMRSNNAVCERSGQLTRRSAVGAMQADRAVREVGHAERRNFDQPDQLIAYLGEVLNERETQRIRAFLSEHNESAKP